MLASELTRPNIVVFMTDQHRADHVGFGGNSVVHTPILDALADRATVFERCYVANPMCTPNRASIITGRYPSAHGARENGIPLDDRSNTAVRMLRRSGYATSLVGKSHLQPYIRTQTPRPGAVVPREDEWDRWEDLFRHTTEYIELPADYYGFDSVDLVIGHGDRCTGHYWHWLIERGVDPDAILGPEVALQRFDDWWQIYQPACPEELYPTSFVREQAVRRVAELAQGERPFMLQCSFPDPHAPFTPPGRYYDLHDPTDMEIPTTFGDTHPDGAPHYRRALERRGTEDTTVWGFSPTERQLREALARQYGAIAMVDDAIGAVLHALEVAGVAGNTIVVFTSDHGDMFGDHSMMLKGAMHYDGCTRVPFCVAGPGIYPKRDNGLVSSVDIAPTLLQLAGIEPYSGTQGRSLKPRLAARAAESGGGRDFVLVEEDSSENLLHTGQPVRLRTVITEDARLTVYGGTEFGELFDRTVDLLELDNRFYDPGWSALRAEMMTVLVDAMMEVADDEPRPLGPG